MKITASQYALSLIATEQSTKVKPKILVENFLKRLKKRGELGRVKKILQALERLEAKNNKEEGVIIETAHPIEESLQKKLLRKAEEIFPDKKLVAQFRTDDTLITGYRIRSATKLFDNSARGALSELSKAFKKM